MDTLPKEIGVHIIGYLNSRQHQLLHASIVGSQTYFSDGLETWQQLVYSRFFLNMSNKSIKEKHNEIFLKKNLLPKNVADNQVRMNWLLNICSFNFGNMPSTHLEHLNEFLPRLNHRNYISYRKLEIPIRCAIRHGNHQVVRWLLRKGYQNKWPDSCKRNFVRHCAFSCLVHEQPKCLQILNNFKIYSEPIHDFDAPIFTWKHKIWCDRQDKILADIDVRLHRLCTKQEEFVCLKSKRPYKSSDLFTAIVERYPNVKISKTVIKVIDPYIHSYYSGGRVPCKMVNLIRGSLWKSRAFVDYIDVQLFTQFMKQNHEIFKFCSERGYNNVVRLEVALIWLFSENWKDYIWCIKEFLLQSSSWIELSLKLKQDTFELLCTKYKNHALAERLEVLKDLIFQKKPKKEEQRRSFNASVILPGQLYLGDIDDAKYVDKTVHVRNIVNMTNPATEVCNFYLGKEGFNYLTCTIPDIETAPIEKHFQTATDFIDKALERGESVLVHCVSGVSRSPTIVAAYLMKKYKLSAKEAIERVSKARPIINPRDSFINALQNWKC